MGDGVGRHADFTIRAGCGYACARPMAGIDETDPFADLREDLESEGFDPAPKPAAPPLGNPRAPGPRA